MKASSLFFNLRILRFLLLDTLLLGFLFTTLGGLFAVSLSFFDIGHFFLGLLVFIVFLLV